MLAIQAIPCLVDLAAWANFNNLSFSNELGYNRWHVAAEGLDSDNLYILKSADFFLKLAGVKDGPVFSLLKEIAQRDCLLKGSRSYRDSGISVAQAVGDCPVLSEYYAVDCAKLYSLVQYIELLFYIEMIVLRQETVSTLKFILPNDEDKYYPDLEQLARDITSFLQYRLGFTGELDIQLLCFKYGKRPSNRPYLNTTLGLYDNATLTIEDIVEDECMTAPTCGGRRL